MSVSAITSRSTRERFVFVRRRPSLCGDRLDGQASRMQQSTTGWTPFVLTFYCINVALYIIRQRYEIKLLRVVIIQS